MASTKYHTKALNLAVILVIIFSLIRCPFSSSDGSKLPKDSENLNRKKLMLGSRPPQCVKRCLNCRPCMPALVVPPPHANALKESSLQKNESYYLLSWKCRCGNRYFQP